MQRGADAKLDPDAGQAWLQSLGLLVILGLFCSLFLTLHHWKVHFEPGHVSICAVNEEINCDTVALSSHSFFAGAPISVWGVVGCVLILALIGSGYVDRRPPWPWAMLGGLFAAAAGICVYLFLVSHLLIHSLCLFCLGLYLVFGIGALVCIIGQLRVGFSPWVTTSFVCLSIAAGAGGFVALHYDSVTHGLWLVVLLALAALGLGIGLVLRAGITRWQIWFDGLCYDWGVLAGSRLRASLLVVSMVTICIGLSVGFRYLYQTDETEIAGGTQQISHGVDKDGHHWIGAANPQLTIVEYSDYECPFCRQAHQILRQVVRNDKDWLRLLHVHMPLDMSCNLKLIEPFHHYACGCAKAAICAGEQDAFWAMNDRLFLRGCGLDKGGLAVLAQNMGLDEKSFRSCLNSAKTQEVLLGDLQICYALKLRMATPAFRIGDEIIVGPKDRVWWEQTLQEYRTKLRQHVTQSNSLDNQGGSDGEKGPRG